MVSQVSIWEMCIYLFWSEVYIDNLNSFIRIRKTDQVEVRPEIYHCHEVIMAPKSVNRHAPMRGVPS
jgi:hypothetical protein